MGFRRNWFVYLSQLLYMAAAILILIFGVTQYSTQKKYPYLAQTMLIVGFFAAFIIINIILYLITRPFLIRLLTPLKKVSGLFEAIIVLLILGAGLALRIYYIQTYPVAMESDYKFYYDVANMIKDGTLLEKSNNEYIALFPHTYGYSYLLSIVMGIFGSAPKVCLYFNAVISMFTALFCYGIGKYLAGGMAGISALIITCFWPSQIIFTNVNGSEAAFSFVLYGAALLLVFVMKKFNGKNSKAFLSMPLHIIIGVLLSLAAAIRPMSLVFMIAVVLCLILLNYRLMYKKNINELTFGTIFLSKGILRALLIILGYMICTQFVTAGISTEIQKKIAGSGATGYSLMVGLNTKSDGGHSQETMDYLYDSYEATGSADAANQLCMDRAIESVKEDPEGTLVLLAKKFFLVWSNDDYATTTNIVTMNNQGLLTHERETLMYNLADINNIYYLFIVFLSIVGVGYLFVKDNNAQVFVVFFVGAIVMHLLVEMQNRYHYYLLQTFAILAAVGLGLLFQRYLEKSQIKLTSKASLFMLESEAAKEAAITLEISSEEVKDITNNNSKKMDTVNVIEAIKDGHIIITATKAYEKENAEKVNLQIQESEQLDNIEIIADESEQRAKNKPRPVIIKSAKIIQRKRLHPNRKRKPHGLGLLFVRKKSFIKKSNIKKGTR